MIISLCIHIWKESLKLTLLYSLPGVRGMRGWGGVGDGMDSPTPGLVHLYPEQLRKGQADTVVTHIWAEVRGLARFIQL